MHHCLILAVLALLCLGIPAVAQDDSRKLIVHEWGTFTSFQDERGNAITGVNSEDESLPAFVYNINNGLIASPFSKGIPRCHPDVTMRLETPVLYFHPPLGTPRMSLDVSVDFRGGWLTQFYPFAEAAAPGMNVEFRTADGKPGRRMGRLKADAVGNLTWRNAILGTGAPLMETKLGVWTAPRAVDAATVSLVHSQQNKIESEKFLFYRGVGNLNAPLRLARDGGELTLTSQLSPALSREPMPLKRLWLAQFRGKTCAFRTLDAIDLSLPKERGNITAPVARVPATFSESDFSEQNLAALRKTMLAALIEDGLFKDEAEALLNTWEQSYFKSAGLRLFFLVPRAWTDHYLPLKLSVPSVISRTMVGRIEIVTPEERALVKRISEIATPPPGDKSLLAANQKRSELYGQLGRFRQALILDELKKRPTENLRDFARRWQLTEYEFPAELAGQGEKGRVEQPVK